jgi:hypothetical protein
MKTIILGDDLDGNEEIQLIITDPSDINSAVDGWVDLEIGQYKAVAFQKDELIKALR